MTRTVLQIIQTATSRMGVPSPQQAVGSPDNQVAQLVALLGAAGEYVAQEYVEMEEFSRTSSWTSVSGENQGPITTLLGTEAGSALNYIIPETFWDQTLRRPIFGGITPQQLQMLRTFIPAGPYTQYQLSGGNLLLSPPTQAGHTMTCAWKSKNWLVTYPLGIGQPSVLGWQIVSDADYPLFDDAILVEGLKAFWKREKGLAYADDFARFEAMCETKAGRSQAKEPLYLDGPPAGIVPGIFVPAGNWPIS